MNNLDTGIKQAESLLEQGKPIEAAYTTVGVLGHNTYSIGATISGNTDDGMQYVFNDEKPDSFMNKAANAGHEALYNTDEFVVAYAEGGLEEAAGVVSLIVVDVPNIGVQYLSDGEYGFDGMAYEATKDYMDQGFQMGERALTLSLIHI